MELCGFWRFLILRTPGVGVGMEEFEAGGREGWSCFSGTSVLLKTDGGDQVATGGRLRGMGGTLTILG